jgi:hexosaminidase
MIKISLFGDVSGLMEGFEQVRGDLRLENAAGGLPVAVKKGTCLKVTLKDGKAEIEYAEPVLFFRALALLVLELKKGADSAEIKEEPAFQKTGIMFDCSRNAVLTVDTLKFFLRRMALMGLNLGMMYTEDTYEVPEYPYFGYMRGKYTFAELKEADDYAALFGIELMPCIQTLAHLNRAFHWPQMQHLRDTSEVLMVGEEASYRFLDSLIKSATAPYRSKRIHIGMDEAFDLGLGNYLRKNGYRPSTELMAYHLKKVKEILDKYGLKAMMWSDMYFRDASPSHAYYDLKNPPSQQVVDSAPEDIDLVYWDYYNEDEEILSGMLAQHKRFKANTCYAGGIWTFCGPATDYAKTIRASAISLSKCKEYGVKEVFATAWGDNGSEANMFTILYGLQLFAEISYTGGYNPEVQNERFRITCGAEAECFTSLSEFNASPDMVPMYASPIDACKLMLYQDPLIPLFEKDIGGFDLEAHYASLAEKYRKYAESTPAYSLLFGFYASLAKALSFKSGWHQRAASCVREKDYTQAEKLADSVPDIIQAVRELKKAWFDLWNSTNKPYGFEILDLRLGGIISRLETAQYKMSQFAQRKTDDIPELSSEKFLYTADAEGKINGTYNWAEIVSACKVSNRE